MRIANPIYDVVFKYLLEDNKIAKKLISLIIGEERAGSIWRIKGLTRRVKADLNLDGHPRLSDYLSKAPKPSKPPLVLSWEEFLGNGLVDVYVHFKLWSQNFSVNLCYQHPQSFSNVQHNLLGHLFYNLSFQEPRPWHQSVEWLGSPSLHTSQLVAYLLPTSSCLFSCDVGNQLQVKSS